MKCFEPGSLTFDHEWEEAFLREKSLEGWAMTSYMPPGIYNFEPCEKGKYFYRIAFIRCMNDTDFLIWTKNLREEGIELVRRMKNWAYFRSTKDFSLYEGKQRTKVFRSIRNCFAAMGLCVSASGILLSMFRRKKWASNFLINVLTGLLSGLYIHGAVTYDQKLEAVEHNDMMNRGMMA